MELTEVRINLCGEHGSRLKAFCSLTFDNTFVIRDVKLIDGNDGLFLAMPSRKLCDHCPSCKEKNHLRARYCNNCGRRLNESRYLQYRNGNGNCHGNGAGHGGGHGSSHGSSHGSRLKLHADIAHPINAECRQDIERRVLEAYDRELERSRLPGYVPPSLDGEDFELYDERPARTAGSPAVLGAVATAALRPTGTSVH